jgi:predicted enzyme related to lactoylglutathione lyase
MSERDGFGPGVPCWVDTWQPDAASAAAFYAALFGWETEPTDAPAGATAHVMCRLRGRDVAAIVAETLAMTPVPVEGSVGLAEGWTAEPRRSGAGREE